MKIKNNTENSGVWAGQTIASGALYTIPPSELQSWQNNSQVLTDIGNGNLKMNDDVNDINDVAQAINYLKQVDPAPRDFDGSIINRPKFCKIGWHFQVHGLEFTSSLLGSNYNKSINPTTFVESDLGFSSLKCYDSNGSELTDQASCDAGAVTTVIDWTVNYEMEIIGGILNQATPPTQDIRMWVIGAPGIANVPFGQGGMNLKLAGIGRSIDVDGKAAKYLHPSLPIPGVNKFRTILKHPAGVKHTAQFIFELFKP